MQDLPFLKQFPYENNSCKFLLLDNEDVFDVLKVYNEYKVSPYVKFTFSKKHNCAKIELTHDKSIAQGYFF